MDRRQARRRIRRFRFGAGSLRHDVDDELRFHVEMLEAELIARGLSPDAARAQARQRFGDPDRHRQACREVGARLRKAERRGEIMTDLWMDIRFALRSFLNNPGFVAVAVTTLALGMAANATIFGMMYANMLAPLPYGDADRVVVLWTTIPTRGVEMNSSSIPDYVDYRDRATSLASLAAHRFWPVNLTGDAEPVGLTGYQVTANVFDTLAVDAHLGRTFNAADDEPGGEPVVVLSWRLWQRLGADDSIVDTSMMLNDVPHRVVGVMPEGFEYPQMQFRGDLWSPARFTAAESTTRRDGRNLLIFGRLADGATAAQATAEVERIAEQIEADNPDTNTGYRARVIGLRDQMSEPVRPAIAVLLVTVGLVMLICCANVANLFLARSSSRDTEIAMRSALGASRLRIVRQLITEGVLIGLMSAAVGLVLSEIGGAALAASLPDFVKETVPTAFESNPRAFVFTLTLLLGIGSVLLFGLLPAVRLSRSDLSEAFRSGSTGKGHAGTRTRNALVVAEVALSVVLIGAAGLTVKGFFGLLNTDPGFDANGVLTFELTLPETRYPEDLDRLRFQDSAIAAIEALPGVETVGSTTLLPLSFSDSTTSFFVEGRPEPEAGQRLSTGYRSVTPGYLEAMRARQVAGRFVDATDRPDTTPVVVINEALARRDFPGEDPVGQRIGFDRDEPLSTIVGVAGDFHHASLLQPPTPEMFVVYGQVDTNRVVRYAVRTSVEPTALATAVREAVWSVDPAIPIEDLQTLGDVVSTSLVIVRVPAGLMAVFGVVALVIAAVGLYGVLAFVVAQRTRELGIRKALGASQSDLTRMVVRRALTLTGTGIVLGTLVVVPLGRVLASLLQGVSGNDWPVYVGVPILLLVVTLLATVAPVRRATSVDPALSLRAD